MDEVNGEEGNFEVTLTKTPRYIDPDVNKEKGFFEGWFSNESSQNNQEYRLSLIEELPVTRLVVLNSQEQIDTTQTAEKILSVLHEQLK